MKATHIMRFHKVVASCKITRLVIILIKKKKAI